MKVSFRLVKKLQQFDHDLNFQVAALLTPEQLSSIFLNVDELYDSNCSFTQDLKDAIEIALDDGDDDLCSVGIGKIFLKAEQSMMAAFKSYCTRQGSASALLASMEKDKELLRIFLKVSQMENTILRRMNLSSFLMVPVQRVTKYPLLLSRLLKVTPSHHEDRAALQESRERIEHHLEHMNQEARDQSTTKLWRRISMINVSSYRKLDNQLDVLGNTTWGIRKVRAESPLKCKTPLAIPIFSRWPSMSLTGPKRTARTSTS